MTRIVQIKNVNQPGKLYPRDADKMEKISAALLSVLPTDTPGLTQSEMIKALRGAVSEADFPGTTHGWWGKSAQLHLEAEGLVIRDPTKPLTWRRA
ncbi:MAG TPA: hypothetical protein PLE81_02815 [Brevundimonas sp.]|uniref:DUF6958 family protein n=1 Tax=Brevundimonas sp. TaxID=1871086 RepID=UPI002BABF1B2|nr:hypothetical protein [Brevundimonas sp.]HRH19548.1 hypothetical protein [Brevundimonas sp.]